jgi:hypothetical protein
MVFALWIISEWHRHVMERADAHNELQAAELVNNARLTKRAGVERYKL